jgi:putative acetyltransferase
MNGYNLRMPQILPLHACQIDEARRVIYAAAHDLFHDRDTLEEAMAYYRSVWPLRDLDDFPQAYLENGGTFLVMWEDGRMIGTGALRRLEEGAGEIKRLWLLPEYQGRGLGYRMMLQLIAVAREKGYTRLRLETSPAYQPRAFAFYRRLGFYEIPRYGDDPDDVGMEMVLE